MPTINQLVRKNRKDKVKKSKAPVLGVGLNTIKKSKIISYSINWSSNCSSGSSSVNSDFNS